MRDYLSTLAHPVFYGPLAQWHLRRPEIFSPEVPRGPVALDSVPGTWTRTQKGPWTLLEPKGHELAPQGWKIHLAPAVPHAEAALARTAEYCVRHGLAFKVLSRLEYVWALNGKYAPRPSSGKSLVIYPDVDDPSTIAADLAALHRGVPGPRVLSSHRVADSIVHLRYGGFLARYTADADGEPLLAIRDTAGRLVPDVRDVVPRTVPGVPIPWILQRSEPFSGEGSAAEHTSGREYRVHGALHYSNTGGVYRAVEKTSGAEVVLKEARHHTGYDAAMADASTRLRRQAEAMAALAGIPGVPGVIETFTQGGSDFLVYEFAAGSTLQEWAAARHPGLLVDGACRIDPDRSDEYVTAVDGVLRDLRELVSEINAAGYVIGDLHPGNVIVAPDGRPWLVDLEAARTLDEDHPNREGPARFVGAAGFFDQHRYGIDLDDYGLAATELYVHNPVVAPAGYLPGALARSVHHARRVLGRDEPWAADLSSRLGDRDGIPLEPECAVAELLAGLAETWVEADGPFRGSPVSTEPFLDVSIGHGPPGAAYALLATGTAPNELPAVYAAWLDTHVDGFGPLGAGLLDGWAGNVVVAEAAGMLDHADFLYDRLIRVLDPRTAPLRLRSGLAGALALALGRRGRSPGDEVERYADVLARRASDELLDPRVPGGGGLLDGRAGVSLILGRAAVALDKPDLMDTAGQLLRQEIDAYVPHPSGALFHHDGAHRILGYLDRGNAGTVLAAAELRAEIDASDDVLRRILQGACANVGVSPGLYRGLSGGLAALGQLQRSGRAPGEVDLLGSIARQADAVASFLGHGPDGRLRSPGELAVRACSEYATGAAGIALALTAATTRPAAQWLPGVF
ncbi:hypothetical protein [Tsukamurella sp. 1534]|uniref:class III lanthionine synthetase LanKC N-terminal domain-containing protein n=1 Tax=Tsukamurella sp. 1534 TaxID=1151061 RepID=UPI0002E801B2|nr:hypothetical protein [Tsukamurella sp. 1534]